MNQTKNFSGLVSLMLAVLIGALPFAAPEACAQALREGLTLCSGPLLLSLYPFLVVSALLIQCPLGDVLALHFGRWHGWWECMLPRGPGAAGGIPGRLCPCR